MAQTTTKTVKTKVSELNNDIPYQTVNDENLTTTNKTVVGGINELNVELGQIGDIASDIIGEPPMKTWFDNCPNDGYYFYNQKNLTNEVLDEILRYNYTSNVTNINNMFQNCYELTTIPLLDTSKVTSMSNVFSRCKNLTNVPLLNTSNVINMSSMFTGCVSLTTIPLIDTSNVTNMAYMLNMSGVGLGISILETLPTFNTSKVTNMDSMCYGSRSLKSIPAWNVSNVTNFTNMFADCTSLEAILMYGMKVGFNISYSTKFTREALVTILNNLAEVTTTQTLTMGATNLAKLTDEDKIIATNKGWTLA